jgi:hypothetical protein
VWIAISRKLDANLPKIVNQIPTDNSTPTRNVAHSLQHIFDELQTSDEIVDSKELTGPLISECSTPSEKHDLWKFSRLLQDNLERITEVR